ncbi:succinate dehydrogenase / fumarate reductase iron-sulfur subunit [Micromonospora pattaloongensis]|uniref:Succinate dehydrogenase / fumarate reductase iron-sulfur subunit n=1 Tax=Micromonospora pattaloongensis TaxID=405436 RepID=A0A1H3G7H7_9ACTN|nr:succinate dehydrogenase/fumarate reductase iron-sulfur subunit [Micromonospora pattaloongensis]SDX99007.1 succinate dehydrogenase / fumarate reductase iron-sulfur subunit [Micromonospora pattaloongensis]
MGTKRQFKVWRGDENGGELQDYQVEVNEGEVVLDVIHRMQATDAPDLACRWNCKAGKCGSCSMEINGLPRLACMTRMSTFEETETVTVTPLRTFPVIRDLVTDVSFNYTKARETPAFAPPAGVAPGEYRMQQVDVERSQEFRKCIECFLCQNTCHVIRDHEDNKKAFAGPRYFIRAAELDMHPLDARTDRREYAQEAQGLGYCNITKCCTEVCPEHIKITDNAIIPMKERVVDRRYDPLVWLGSKIFRREKGEAPRGSAAITATNTGAGPQLPTVTPVPPAGERSPEADAERAVNWHRAVPAPVAPPVGDNGMLAVSEFAFDRPAAPSPFGDDVRFPMPPNQLNYSHPDQPL